MSIQKRKKDHVELTSKTDVSYKKSAGFDCYDFVHNALPELDISEIDLGANLLGTRFSFPLFISSMTGGYTEAGEVNKIIARCCEKYNLPFGVGSQRVMIENPDETESFAVVREHAPTAFIAANIGGVQLIGGLSPEKIHRLVESISANAVIVHLNPLQELMQPEGDRNFRGIEEGIRHLKDHAGCPVIVKETGAGISGKVAQKLLETGIEVIDVAGAGGTSWAKVENLREHQPDPRHLFDDWGIPTADCIEEVNNLRAALQFEMIASGGIQSSFDMIKALALGADFTAAAGIVIKTIVNHGEQGLSHLIDRWMEETRIALTLLGCRSFQELNKEHLRVI